MQHKFIAFIYGRSAQVSLFITNTIITFITIIFIISITKKLQHCNYSPKDIFVILLMIPVIIVVNISLAIVIIIIRINIIIFIILFHYNFCNFYYDYNYHPFYYYHRLYYTFIVKIIEDVILYKKPLI